MPSACQEWYCTAVCHSAAISSDKRALSACAPNAPSTTASAANNAPSTSKALGSAGIAGVSSLAGSQRGCFLAPRLVGEVRREPALCDLDGESGAARVILDLVAPDLADRKV